MEDFLYWAKIICAIIAGIAVLIPIIVYAVKYIKKLISDGSLVDMFNLVMNLVPIAEQMFEEGTDKKKFVLDTIEKFSTENALTFDRDKVSELIDAIVAVTKFVNIKIEEKKSIEVTEDAAVIKEETVTEVTVKEEIPSLTKADIQNAIVKISGAENGYWGHESRAHLDEKQNCGAGGLFTKYARDLDNISYFNGEKQGYAWCCVFANWLYYEACEEDKALTLKLLGEPEKNNWAAGTGPFCRYLTKVTATKPADCEIGDIVAYNYDDNEDIDHVGVIYNKDSKYIYVCQGNAISVGPKGGVGTQFIHSVTHKNVCGIYRPHWEVLTK